MCQSLVDGGKRCQCDGSQARNHRRIRSSIAKSHTLESSNTPQRALVDIEPTRSMQKSAHTIADYRKALLGAGVKVGTRGRLSSEDILHAQSLLAGEATLHSIILIKDDSNSDSLSEQAAEVSRKIGDSFYTPAKMEKIITEFGQKVADKADALAGVDKFAVKKERKEAEKQLEQLLKEKEIIEAEYQEMENSVYPADDDELRARGFTDESSYYQRVQYLSQDELDEFRRKVTLNENKMRKISETARGIKKQVEHNAASRHKKRAAAYRQLLAEIRPMGGTLTNIGAKSDKKSVVLLQTALKDMPSSWVESGNEGDSIRVAASTGRAHYLHKKPVVTKKRILDTVVVDASYYVNESDRDHPFQDTDHREYVQFSTLTDEEKIEYGISLDGYAHADDSFYLKKKFDVARTEMYGSPCKPKGTGWEKVPTLNQHSPEGTMVWRRPRTRLEEVSSDMMSEITVTKDTSPISEDGVSTAAHEFVHRVEYTRSHIAQLAHQFVIRRTTGDDGVRDKQKRYMGSRDELVRPDHFAEKYMGKEYPDLKTHEVLTCGVQALFHGDIGGLMGEGKYLEDLDSRNFILGMLATA